MKSLARHFEFPRVALRPAFFAKIQVKAFVVSVKFISDNAMPYVLRVGADLVLSSRVELNSGEGISVPAIQRFEKSNGGLRVRTFSHALFDENGTCGIGTQRGIDVLRLAHFAFENREVSFGNPTALDGFLAFACSFAIERDEDNAAGFAIEAGNEMHCFASAPFPHRTDEARPRTVF